MAGTLFVVATPIGNLEDLSFRALRTLKEVDLIAAEDTRRTAKLLAHYEIRSRWSAFTSTTNIAKRRDCSLACRPARRSRWCHGRRHAGISDPGPIWSDWPANAG